jgi:hypothetical protein
MTTAQITIRRWFQECPAIVEGEVVGVPEADCGYPGEVEVEPYAEATTPRGRTFRAVLTEAEKGEAWEAIMREWERGEAP